MAIIGGSGLVIRGDIKSFLRFTDPRINRRILEREMRKATIRSSLFLVKQVKRAIRKRRFTKNSELTIALAKAGGKKRSTIPLLKEKNLSDAIAFELKTAFHSEVGLVKDAKTSGGVFSPPEDMKKVAFLLHEGYTIDVTDAMKAAIAIALREIGDRRAAKSLSVMERNKGKGKTTWRVPPRKFFAIVFKNSKNRKVVQKNWRIAIQRAFAKSSGKPVR